MENTNVKWDAWGIECSFFDADILGKEQALFALGNGYMGVRSAVEEEYATILLEHIQKEKQANGETIPD